jgi:pimeloyl-ACP methyl ester carboxylesterase
MTQPTRRLVTLAGVASLAAPRAASSSEVFITSVATLPDGVRLNYLSLGQGTPTVFVHGSLSDLDYWTEQQMAFVRGGERRAIAYSRRYNSPNENAPIRGYSAVTDAQDLAGFIETLKLGRAHIVGHSYGALTALILAARRPELVHTLVLTEPPAMSLLDHVPEPNAAKGKAMLADVQANMVAPMRAAFARGDREAGVRTFIDYVFGKPGAWDAMSAQDHAATMKDAHEWDVMLTTGELFPTVTPDAVRSIKAPTLALSGGKSYPFLGLIDLALMSLLPNAKRIVFPNATHQMWLQEPQACRQAALELQSRA